MRCFPLKGNKILFAYESRYVSLVRFLFTSCVKHTHSLRSFVYFTQLVNKNRTRSPTVK